MKIYQKAQRLVLPKNNAPTYAEQIMSLMNYEHLEDNEFVKKTDFEFEREENGFCVLRSPPRSNQIGKLIGHSWNCFWRHRK